MTKLWLLLALIPILCTAGCLQRKVTTLELPDSVSVTQPRQRLNDYRSYFGAERAAIEMRKGQIAAGVPGGGASPRHIGLALSGGGIRSAAFQLGLMSGLHQVGMLKQIDYISAVSGGSWAAGAYKVYSGSDDSFFHTLDRNATQEKTKFCDGSLRTLLDPAFAICKEEGAKILLSSYKEPLKNSKSSLAFLDPLDRDVGFAFREAWRSMIQQNFLLGNDPPLHQIESRFPDRPYLILNATHSERDCQEPESNFPFQFTSHSVGTIADCGNTSYCLAPLSDARYVGVFLPPDEAFPTLRLSHALAISGAVAPVSLLGIELNMMEWRLEFPLPPMAKSVDEVPYRKSYVLADGGHSENFGALALLERNVEILIISDGAFDPDGRFEDFVALKSHAKALLDQDIVLRQPCEGVGLGWITGKDMVVQTPNGPKRLDSDLVYDPDSMLRFNGQFFGINHYHGRDQNHGVTIGGTRYSDICGSDDKCGNDPRCLERLAACRQEREAEFDEHRRRFHGEGYRELESDKALYEGYFTRLGGRDGKLLYVKPPKDLSAFFNYLKAKDCAHIYNYLALNSSNFPCDKTFAVSYHNQLIQAYYLLGKFIAETELSKSLKFEAGLQP